MNIRYIPRLTNEVTEKYNIDEYMSLYSLVLMNIKVHSSVTPNRQIYWNIFLSYT
jgi:hypothetical protein